MKRISDLPGAFALPIHLALATCLGAAFLGFLLMPGRGGQPGEDPEPFQVKQVSSPPDRRGPLSGYAGVVETVKPCIVSILSWSARTSPDGQPGDGSSLSQGTSHLLNTAEVPRDHSGLKLSLMGVGSGVILTKEGHILTNNHVVAESRWIWVVLPESSERLDARILGRDPETDLAVLKVEREQGVCAATFGNSDLMKAGDLVLAIGNPFGLSQTVTSGIVSATSRSNLDIAGFENFIQTDASINPGNSGGALVNSNGEVIGISTAIFSRHGGSVGVGFAISGNFVLKIAKRIVEKGEVARGYLGVTVAALTPALAKIFRAETGGVLVNDVHANSPAERAGCKPGDVITSINGEPVTLPASFQMAVADLEPGTKAEIEMLREGKSLRLEATLARIPTEAEQAMLKPENQHHVARPQVFMDGIYVQELTPALRLEHAIPSSITGIFISHVEPSAILESGLRPGIVICEVLGQRVDSVAEAIKARSSPPEHAGGALLLRVWAAGKGYQFAAVRPTD